mgnify:FL=1|tara:strand:+ start:242 stop:469 length:228 start_codon:yes stop_codon:yes gene_type:complete
MAMNDKELKKIKAMMPSGVSMAKIKSLLMPKSKAGKTADRNPPKTKKAKIAQQQQAAMQQLYKTKRQKVNKAKLR